MNTTVTVQKVYPTNELTKMTMKNETETGLSFYSDLNSYSAIWKKIFAEAPENILTENILPAMVETNPDLALKVINERKLPMPTSFLDRICSVASNTGATLKNIMQHYHICPTNNTLKNCIKIRNFDMVKELVEKNLVVPTMENLQEAFESSSVEIIKFLCENIKDVTMTRDLLEKIIRSCESRYTFEDRIIRPMSEVIEIFEFMEKLTGTKMSDIKIDFHNLIFQLAYVNFDFIYYFIEKFAISSSTLTEQLRTIAHIFNDENVVIMIMKKYFGEKSGISKSIVTKELKYYMKSMADDKINLLKYLLEEYQIECNYPELTVGILSFLAKSDCIERIKKQNQTLDVYFDLATSCLEKSKLSLKRKFDVPASKSDTGCFLF